MTPTPRSVTAADLARAVERQGTPAAASGSAEATVDRLADEVATGDVVLVMGGGRSHLIAEGLADRLRARAAG